MQNTLMPEKNISPDLDKIDQEYKEHVQEIALKKADEDALKPNQMLSKKVLFERYLKEYMQNFAHYRRQQEHGAELLSLALAEISNTEIISEEISGDIGRLSTLIDIIAKDEKKFKEKLSSGASLQELAFVGEATMDVLYKAAKNLYDQKLLSDAADAFSFLCGLNPNNYVFWLGIANSEFNSKHYQEALNAYAVVCQANPIDPAIHLIISRCYEELKLVDKAIDELNVGLAAIEAKVEYADFTNKLTQEKTRLLQRRGV